MLKKNIYQNKQFENFRYKEWEESYGRAVKVGDFLLCIIEDKLLDDEKQKNLLVYSSLVLKVLGFKRGRIRVDRSPSSGQSDSFYAKSGKNCYGPYGAGRLFILIDENGNNIVPFGHVELEPYIAPNYDKELEEAIKELDYWDQKWVNYTGNNPNKFQSSLKNARKKVEYLRQLVKN